MTNLQLFHVVEKIKACQTNSRDKLPFVYSIKSLMFDLMTMLLHKHLILLHCLIGKVMHYQNLFTKLKLRDYRMTKKGTLV